MLQVERVGPEQWERARRIRLRALEDAPDAFWMTAAEEAATDGSAWRARLAAADAVTLVACEDGADVGLAVGAPHHDHPGDAGLYSVWVAPERRRDGVGQALVRAVTTWAWAAGYQCLRLDVGETNTAALGLYARLGFSASGHRCTFPAPRSHIREQEQVLDLRSPLVHLFRTVEAPDGVLERVRDLLQTGFAGGFSEDDWAHALGGWHALVTEADNLLAHAAVVPRVLEIDGRPWWTGYVEAVATLPARRGQGYGSLAVSHLMQVLRHTFDLGALSTDRPAFYRRLGWERWQGPTYVRRGADLIRTEDEDAGIMVLRFGPSLAIDLAAPIACEARPGDDW